MAFSDAVQWWEEWQLRILVLCSLFLQYFLFIAASLRKRCLPPWFKFLTWLAYLASDAVAIYALATLFNRHKRQEWLSTHRNSASLEVLWAPILLLHLGGQDGITAYNIEDNELWRRHVLTAVSQITVAIYVFRKSWSGEKRLLQAAILIFVPGILKCLEKPFALKSASIHSIGDTSNKTWVERMFEDESKDNDIKSLDDYVEAASTYVQGDHAGETAETEVNDKPYNQFVDLAFPYSDRLKNLKYMMQKKNKAHRRLRSRLSNTFDRLYTKHEMTTGGDWNICDLTSKNYSGNLLRRVVVYLTFAAIALFHKSHRQNYDDTDVKITYTLLCCTAALEFIIYDFKPYFDCFNYRTWPDLVAQYNLLWYLARNRKHRRLLLICRDYIDEIWCMKPCQSSSDITELVFDHVVNHGWKNRIKDAATFHEFNNNRGQQTLQREGCNEGKPLESLQRPFDESVILWHLATDFCFFHHRMDAAGKSASGGHGDGDARRRSSREISNYMAYLLFTNPEMLMPGSRRSLFKDAYEKLKKMAGDEDDSTSSPIPNGTVPTQKKTKKPSLLDEQQMIASQIMQKLQSAKEGSEGLVLGAWFLAQELMGIAAGKDDDDGLEGEEKMWRVIQGVWVEMLCFSAGRCRGFLHAKSLGKGGEYLSYVWMLMSFLGMETLAERLQRTELHVQGDMGATRPMTPAASEMPTPTGNDNV
ncbi:uncharacterized protein [Miscanthus floridulus]|uniref:uncharacterized protein n=1 Tax=Miscanthus floridulus TaxID=154761 RepID=UPI00345990F8